MTKRNKKECPKCQRKISLSNFNRHYNSCGKYDYLIKVKEEWLDENTGKYSCPYCNALYSKHGISSHIHLVHTEKGRERFIKTLNHNRKEVGNYHVSWNRGLTKETDERVKSNGEKVSVALQKLKKEGKLKPTKHTEEFKQRQSERMSLHNPGGRSNWYEVNGIKVQGTWERNIAERFTECGIKWIKPSTAKHCFKYKMGDKVRTYTPDFYIEELNLYIEVKGYWWGDDKEKMNCVINQYSDANILIIDKKLYEEFVSNVKILDGELVW